MQCNRTRGDSASNVWLMEPLFHKHAVSAIYRQKVEAVFNNLFTSGQVYLRDDIGHF
jgi:hypothetical protein